MAELSKKYGVYLVAIMDWHSRKVLSWRLSNSMEADFCVEALNEAMARYGKPGIMDSDHPSHGLQANHCRAAGQPVHRLRMDAGAERCGGANLHGW